MIQHPEIYKFDSKGKLRSWRMERDGSKYRTVAGLADGKKTTSKWTKAFATNVGRSNMRDGIEQAIFEVEAAYEKKLTREYHRTVEAAKGGAHFVKPMLAKTYAKFPGTCLVQPKLDGIRCIATKDGLFSRQGKPITAVPHIHAALQPAFDSDPDLKLDGELYNHDLKDDFQKLVSIVRKQKPTAEQLEAAEAMQYHVYDLVHQAAFSARMATVGKILAELDCPWIVEVSTVRVDEEAELDQLHAQFLEDGYEGSIIRLNGFYEQKRSKQLLKYKEFDDAEFKIIRIDEGEGNWSGIPKVAVCELDNGKTFGATLKGSQEYCLGLDLEAQKVATVRYFGFSNDGVPRFPVAVALHGAERVL